MTTTYTCTCMQQIFGGAAHMLKSYSWLKAWDEL